MSSLLPSRPALRHASLAALAAGALAVSGCGDDGKDPTTTAAAPTTGAPVQAALADDVPATAVAFAQGDIRPEGDTKAGVLEVSKALGIADPGKALIDELDLDDLAPDGKRFQADVLPHLGDHVGGFLIERPAKGRGDGPTASGALVAEVRDANALRAALGPELRKGTKLDVDGQEVYRERGDDKDPLTVWIGDRTLSIGKEDAVRQAIAAGAGDDLAGAARYRGAIGQVRATDPLAVAWVDLRHAQVLDGLLEELSGSVDAEVLNRAGIGKRHGGRGDHGDRGALGLGAAMPNIDATLALAAEATPGRIAIQSGGTQPEGAGGAAGGGADAVAALPSGSWLGAGLGDLRSGLLGGLAGGGVEGKAKGEDPKETVRGLGELLGVRLPDQLLEDLDGIRSVTLGARGDSLLSLGGAVVVQAKDAGAADRFLTALTDVLREKGLRPQPRDIAGAQKGVVGQFSGLPLQVAAAVSGDKVAVGLGPDSVAGALQPKGRLGDDPIYREAQEALGGTKPQLLLNARRIADLLGSLPMGRFEGVLQVVRRLQLLTAGSQSTGATTWRGSVVLKYGPPASGSSGASSR
ncbi:hypothetical protein [Patulibacter defluvii]|uniref:hypothetical protein n=1 Tax=Patulibacter defluvii TaxID=3095358 RepID=UPI002A75256C|nr:hypothetical protein [Patulibacter sp. DM4]